MSDMQMGTIFKNLTQISVVPSWWSLSSNLSPRQYSQSLSGLWAVWLLRVVARGRLPVACSGPVIQTGTVGRVRYGYRLGLNTEIQTPVSIQAIHPTFYRVATTMQLCSYWWIRGWNRPVCRAKPG